MRDKELAHLFGLADLSGANAGPVASPATAASRRRWRRSICKRAQAHRSLERRWAARKSAQVAPDEKPKAKPEHARLARSGAP